VLLQEIEERFGIIFEDSEDIDTIAGWVQYQKIDPVEVGDEVTMGSNSWTVTEMENYQIKQVRFLKKKKK
jgi:CBS domain containing-hemolysin-like protein